MVCEWQSGTSANRLVSMWKLARHACVGLRVLVGEWYVFFFFVGIPTIGG
jgi:hypothetical protein